MVDYSLRPKIGTFVVWRFKGEKEWETGITYGRIGSDNSNGVIDKYQTRRRFDKIEYKVIEAYNS